MFLDSFLAKSDTFRDFFGLFCEKNLKKLASYQIILYICTLIN